MILFVNPRATRRRTGASRSRPDGGRRRAARDTSWEIVDGNRPGVDALATSAARGAAGRRRRPGARGGVHGDARAAAGERGAARAAVKARFPERADRVGRQLRQPLPRAGAERAVCRLARPRPGRADLRRAAARCWTARATRADRRRPRLPRGRRQRTHQRPSGPGPGPDELPPRPITRSTSATISTRPSWAGARACTRRRSAARTAASSAA